MKLQPQSSDKLLAKACQCQADADTIGEIIARLKTLESELLNGFGGVEERLEADRLAVTVRYLTESADYIRYISHSMKNISDYLKELEANPDIFKPFK